MYLAKTRFVLPLVLMCFFRRKWRKSADIIEDGIMTVHLLEGLAFDLQGRLWEQEFGNSIMDEANLIVKGGNYGWSSCEGASGSCSNPYSIAPKQTYITAERSCSDIVVVRDALYVACLWVNTSTGW